MRIKENALILLLVVLALLNIGCAKKNPIEVNILSVSDVIADPLAFTGEVMLTGITGNFFEAEPDVFELYYTNSVLGKDACCMYMFPIKLPDNFQKPQLGDEITVTGSFIKYDVAVDIGYGYEYIHDVVFEVKKIEVKRNVMHLIL